MHDVLGLLVQEQMVSDGMAELLGFLIEQANKEAQ